MQRPSARVLAFLVFCFLLTALAWWGARWAQDLPKRMAAATEAALQKKAYELRDRFFALGHFQPRIKVRQRVLAETSSQIAELAVLEKETEIQREFGHTWAGSTKTLRLRGKYRVKIGFNLLDRFEIQVEQGKGRIQLPPATVLSVEQTGMQVEALENGFWNPISANDLQTSIAALHEEARAQGQKLVPQAEKVFTDRLRQLSGSPIEVVTVPEPPR
ncbi:MAG TPA: DUF4230 domain-containing protein [Chthoniobacterales bacterium]|jgi:hypothetical protein